MLSTYIKLLILMILVHGSSAEKCSSYTIEGSSENQTVIRLIGNGNESAGLEIDNRVMEYEWNVWARSISIAGELCTTLTRAHVPCYLHAWKTANGLNDQLRRMENDKGRTLIINNTWIHPGIIYTVELKIIHNKKIINKFCIEIININMDSLNIEENIIPATHDNVGLTLIGPNQTFCNSKTIINAVVVGNYKNAAFHWSLKDTKRAIMHTLPNQGTRLELPGIGMKFINDGIYEVICELLTNKNGMINVLSKDSLKLHVHRPKFVVKLESRNQTIGLNQPIDFISHVEIPSLFDHQILWTCTKIDSTNCGKFSGPKILYLQNGFSEVGIFKFDLTVTAIDFKTTLTTYLHIVNNSIRSIDPDEVPTWINPTEELLVPTELRNIRSGCTLKWTSIHNLAKNEDNESYQELDFSKSNYDDIAPVFVKRDAFLKELAPHSMEPGDQTIVLKIKPEAFKTTEDCRYLIRLDTGCEGRSAISADLELATNAPPRLTKLQVYPVFGTALLTVFRFITTPALDKDEDLPVTYNFGWSTSKDFNKTSKINYFSIIQGICVTETILPYVEETKGTLFPLLKVCDNKDSCSILRGPKIMITLPDLSEDNQHMFKERILRELASNDLDRFTYDFLNTLKTFQSLENQIALDDLQNATNVLLNEKIKYLLDKPNKATIYELIASLRKIWSLFQPSMEVHKNLVKLRGKLVNEQMSSSIVTDDEINALEIIKEINSKNMNERSIEDIKKYFEMTEFLIASTDDDDLVKQEKDDFMKNIDKYLNELCVLLYLDAEMKVIKISLVKSYIILEKFTSAYFRNFKYIPNANNEWKTNIQIMLNQTWYMDVLGTMMCIAKGMFREYMDYKDVLYFAKLYSNDMSDLKLKDQSHTIRKALMDTSSHQCSVYSDGSWQTCRKSQVKSNNIACMCDKMGYYKIDKANGDGDGDDNGVGDEGSNGSNPIITTTTKQPEDNENSTGSGNQDGGITMASSTASSISTTKEEDENSITKETDDNNVNTSQDSDGNKDDSGNTGNGNVENTEDTSILPTLPTTKQPEENASTNSTTTIQSISTTNEIENQDGEITTTNTAGSSNENTVEVPSTEDTFTTSSAATLNSNNPTERKSENDDNETNQTDPANMNGTTITNDGNNSVTTPMATTTSIDNNNNINYGSTIVEPTISQPDSGTTDSNTNTENTESESDGSNGSATVSPGIQSTSSGTSQDGNEDSTDNTNHETSETSNSNMLTSAENGNNPDVTTTVTTTEILEETDQVTSTTTKPIDTTINKDNNINPGNTHTTVDLDELAIEGGSDGDDVSDIETTENITGSFSNIITKDEVEKGTSTTNIQNSPTTPLGSDENSSSINHNTGETNNKDTTTIKDIEGSTLNLGETNVDKESETNPGNEIGTNNSGSITSGTTPGINSPNNNLNNNVGNNNNGSNTNSTNMETSNGANSGTTSSTFITQTPPQTTTSDTLAAGVPGGSYLSLGDQISFVVIGLCVLGTSGLILFAIISKRVRKVRAEESIPSEYPMYADIINKENMHGIASSG